MRARWWWLLALVLPLVGGIVAGAWESNAGTVIGACIGLVAPPLAALLATWALLPRVHWFLRALVGVIVGLAWLFVTFTVFFIAYVIAGGETDFSF